MACWRWSQLSRAQTAMRWRAPTTMTGPARPAKARRDLATTMRPWLSGWTSKVAARKESYASCETSPRPMPSSHLSRTAANPSSGQRPR
jgi:hypothetical protein